MKVLLCGDNYLLMRLIQEELASENYEIRLVDLESDIIQQIDDFEPDMLITNILISQLNGFELIQYARTKFPKILIIVLSALSAKRLVELSYRLGADDFISMPFDPERLSIRIKKLIHQKQSSLIFNVYTYASSI